MRLLLVTGIFPPDIGGPATHSADLRDEFIARGHTVEVLSLTDERSWSHESGVVRFPRRWPWPVRNAAALAWIAIRGRRFDAVYATGLDAPAVAGARLAGRPVVLKIVGDPAWERATRRNLTDAGFDDFQNAPDRSIAVRAMKWLRSWSTRRANVVITPSDHLRTTAQGWSNRDDVIVVPNGVRTRRDEGTGSPAGAPLRALFVGRLVPWKRVDLLIEAVAQAPDASLEIVGDGPEAEPLRLAGEQSCGDRVRFLGTLGHDEALRRIAAADVLALASSYEGMSHVLIEALASGTPVVATREAGSGGIVVDGINGVVVDPTAEAFATAFERLAAGPRELERLRQGALESGRDWTIERCADRIEQSLRRLTTGRPRAVFLGKNAVPVPLDDEHRRKFAIHRPYLDTFVVCAGDRFRVARSPGLHVVTIPAGRVKPLSTPAFYAIAPLAAVAAAAGPRPAALVCQSPYEAAGALAWRHVIPARWRPRVQVEVHGDWRTATTLYGSPRRRHLSAIADGVASWALRRADRIRVVSAWLEELVRDAGYRGPIDSHIAFSDYDAFYAPPPTELPHRPHVLFVGVLERYKAVDVLLDAWPEVLERVPDAELTILGAGTEEAALRTRIGRAGVCESVTMLAPLPRTGVRRLLDRSWCLCLPSRSEGLGRIVLEAMAAGRAVVTTRVGGPEELVTDEVNGRLVPPDDRHALADAIVDVIGDRERAQRMGVEGRRRAELRDPLAEYEAGIERLARWISEP